MLILYNQNHAVWLCGSHDNMPLKSPCSSGERFPDGHSCCLLGSPLPAAHECVPAQLLCCRKGDPFQGPRVDPCLTLRYKCSEETHVLTRQGTGAVEGWREHENQAKSVTECRGVGTQRHLRWLSNCVDSNIQSLYPGAQWKPTAKVEFHHTERDTNNPRRIRSWSIWNCTNLYGVPCGDVVGGQENSDILSMFSSFVSHWDLPMDI